jgi:nicotinamide-nucleotide amidase
MIAHIITIGDEILIGQTLNTNAACIGDQLTNIQIAVNKTSVVGDDHDDIMAEFKTCWAKNDLLIVTGGLGPTHDDITRNCIVKFFKTELVQNDDVLEDIRRLFQKRGRDVRKINEAQGLVPKVAKIIRNEYGTAPGIWIEKDNKIFIAMPGVPYEMHAMMDTFVIPNLIELLKDLSTVQKRITLETTGIPESFLFEKLGDISDLLDGAKMAFLPSAIGVRMRITVSENNEEDASNKLIEIEQKIRSKAGRYVFGRDGEKLEEVVGRILHERGLKISIAESCTGGYLSNLLTNVSGSSKYFESGLVAYSNASKVEIVKVDEDTINEYGSVSLEVAKQMAEGIKAISGTDIGVSITGIMGPTGGTDTKPIGLVYIGFCDEEISIAKKFTFGDDRHLNKQRAAQAALEMVRRHLLGISLDD